MTEFHTGFTFIQKDETSRTQLLQCLGHGELRDLDRAQSPQNQHSQDILPFCTHKQPDQVASSRRDLVLTVIAYAWPLNVIRTYMPFAIARRWRSTRYLVYSSTRNLILGVNQSQSHSSIHSFE